MTISIETAAKWSLKFTLAAFVIYVAAVTWMVSRPTAEAAQWDSYHWNEADIEWWGDESALNGLVSGAMTQVTNGAAQWESSNTGANIDWSEASTQGASEVDIVIIDFDVWSLEGIPGRTTVSAEGDGSLTAAAAWLNSDSPGDGGFTWYTDGTMDQDDRKADVRTVAMHEMGHTFGLADNASPTNKVMNPDWTQKWTLTSSDKSDLGSIY